MEQKPKPEELPEIETTRNGWEHLRDLGRAALSRLNIEGWSKLPPVEAAEPFYAAEEHNDWELADKPEDGWVKRGVGIPDRTDGTRPRAV